VGIVCVSRVTNETCTDFDRILWMVSLWDNSDMLTFGNDHLIKVL